MQSFGQTERETVFGKMYSLIGNDKKSAKNSSQEGIQQKYQYLHKNL